MIPRHRTSYMGKGGWEKEEPRKPRPKRVGQDVTFRNPTQCGWAHTGCSTQRFVWGNMWASKERSSRNCALCGRVNMGSSGNDAIGAAERRSMRNCPNVGEARVRVPARTLDMRICVPSKQRNFSNQEPSGWGNSVSSWKYALCKRKNVLYHRYVYIHLLTADVAC